MIPTDMLRPYEGKTILISGAAGYVGSALVEALCGVPCDLILIVRRMPARPQVMSGPAKYEVVEGDVSQRSTWLRAVPGADYVFHLAAHEHRHGSAWNPLVDLEVNSVSVFHLLEVCRQEGLSPRIAFASSTNLVSVSSRSPVNETLPDNPPTLFGINKLMAEKYLQYYAEAFNLRTVILRLSNVYGPVPDPEIAVRVVLNRIISKAVRGGPLTLFENQSCVRDYIFIDDVVAAFLAAPAIERGGIGRHFVIGAGVGYRIMDAVQLVAERVTLQTGNRPRIEHDGTVLLEPVEWRSFVADSSQFHDATGWSAKVPLVEGIDRTVGYFCRHLRESQGCGF